MTDSMEEHKKERLEHDQMSEAEMHEDEKDVYVLLVVLAGCLLILYMIMRLL